jgi:MFS family permease
MTATTQDPTDAPEIGVRTYLTVLRTPGMPTWALSVLCQRLPIAMAPLALVYLGHAASGSFAAGALLAGAFAFAEAVAAGVMGRRFDRKPAGPELRLVLGMQAVAFLLLSAPATIFASALPIWVLTVPAAVAGAVASGAHGGLRSLLVRSVPSSAHHAALSLEATTTTLLWAVGPALVGLLAVLAGPTWPTMILAVIAGLGILAASALRDPGPASDAEGDADSVRVWRLSWPALFQEGAVMTCVGAAYTGLPPLLEAVGANADLTGPVLAVFAVVGIIGGLVYGSRRWPGAYRSQSVVLVLSITVALGAASLSPTAGIIITLVILSGLVGTPALTARAAGIQEMLPESVWATGFSGLYAAGGVGFGIASIVIASLLEVAGTREALLACVAIAALATVVSGIAEARMARAKVAAKPTPNLAGRPSEFRDSPPAPDHPGFLHGPTGGRTSNWRHSPDMSDGPGPTDP